MARNRINLTDSLSPAVAKAMPTKTDDGGEAPLTAGGSGEVLRDTSQAAERDTSARGQDDGSRSAGHDVTKGKDEKKAKRQERAGLDARVNLGVYLSADTYDEMKAAYLADWTNRRGDADTLYQWVADALDAHAARSVAERTSLPQEKRATTRTGNTRAFKVPTDVTGRMQAALAADEKAGRWSSESAWSVEAVTLAIEAARTANGGNLPEPPARLPNRLKRRD